jgi:hypothetical protein
MQIKRILLAATVVGAAVAAPLVVTSSASAEPLALCEVSVTIEKQPGVIIEPNKVGVETGEYRPYTDCVNVRPILDAVLGIEWG